MPPGRTCRRVPCSRSKFLLSGYICPHGIPPERHPCIRRIAEYRDRKRKSTLNLEDRRCPPVSRHCPCQPAASLHGTSTQRSPPAGSVHHMLVLSPQPGRCCSAVLPPQTSASENPARWTGSSTMSSSPGKLILSLRVAHSYNLRRTNSAPMRIHAPARPIQPLLTPSPGGRLFVGLSGRS